MTEQNSAISGNGHSNAGFPGNDCNDGTDDLHLALTPTPMEPPTMESQKMHYMWTQLQIGMPIATWGPLPDRHRVEGHVSHKIDANDAGKRILTLTHFNNEVEEEVVYDYVTAVHILGHGHQSSQVEEASEEKRVLSGAHQFVNSDSWSSTSTSMLFENTYSNLPEIRLELPLLPSGKIDD